LRRVAGLPVLPRMDLAAQRRRTMSRCQRTIVSGVTKKGQLRGSVPVVRRSIWLTIASSTKGAEIPDRTESVAAEIATPARPSRRRIRRPARRQAPSASGLPLASRVVRRSGGARHPVCGSPFPWMLT
jgi:hypothetical protein